MKINDMPVHFAPHTNTTLCGRNAARVMRVVHDDMHWYDDRRCRSCLRAAKAKRTARAKRPT